jgi:excinuclease ABC subunit C
MKIQASNEEYERALVLRNQISAIEKLSVRQQVEKVTTADTDVIAYRRAGSCVFVMVFSFEKGRLAGKQEFSFSAGDDFFEEFLARFYADRIPPTEIILPDAPGDAIREYLSQRRGRAVTITVPKAGDKKKQLDLVATNIEHAFFRDAGKVSDLKSALGLAVSPEVIECFDISHLSGTSTAGSMVQFRSGRPDKKNYRRFRIRSVDGIDDFAAIGEIVKRRYRRVLDEGKQLPDLVVIDGGRGQLTSALDALAGIDVTIPVIAIAKREEDVYMPGEILPRRLDEKGLALRYLQEIRNEAHRFAISYHTLLRSKRAI